MGGEDIYYYCVVTNTNGENKEQTASKPALIRVREVPKLAITEKNKSEVQEKYQYYVDDTNIITLVGELSDLAEDISVTYKWETSNANALQEAWSSAGTNKECTPSTSKGSVLKYKLTATVSILHSTAKKSTISSRPYCDDCPNSCTRNKYFL